MSENPFEAIRKACDSFGKCFQTHLSRILPARCEDHLDKPSSVAGNSKTSSFSFFTASNPKVVNDAALLTPDVIALEKKITAAPLTKEELGRATWTLLHTVAAQFPDIPTRQQKRDVKELMAILSRIYPCKECADHFKEVLKSNPVQAGSQAELSQWICHVHNIVNRSLGKQIFPCQRVNARWGKLDCLDRSCDLQGSTNLNFPV
ncbi:FAD-linked sulfhydryl oxidase ERV1 isoform X2 [Dendrobium catenatum]|uniref:Sulfhydryl oxidase n=1 Tax=Dendrobium catenatum TaxID=906689 RepID=A0A2I0VRC3_9ASPA|nr:FAD-linked sulfhydryl oxidase ERV1 isoform X2 [Dendrobium catenatum]PKU65933.1 FAD-linked sulfhydryl oxidase ERV1 [Dendrobium catenatum]